MLNLGILHLLRFCYCFKICGSSTSSWLFVRLFLCASFHFLNLLAFWPLIPQIPKWSHISRALSLNVDRIIIVLDLIITFTEQTKLVFGRGIDIAKSSPVNFLELLLILNEILVHEKKFQFAKGIVSVHILSNKSNFLCKPHENVMSTS